MYKRSRRTSKNLTSRWLPITRTCSDKRAFWIGKKEQKAKMEGGNNGDWKEVGVFWRIVNDHVNPFHKLFLVMREEKKDI